MKFKEIIKRVIEDDCGSDSAPPDSTFDDADNAKGPGDRIGSNKKQKTKMFKKKMNLYV